MALGLIDRVCSSGACTLKLVPELAAACSHSILGKARPLSIALRLVSANCSISSCIDSLTFPRENNALLASLHATSSYGFCRACNYQSSNNTSPQSFVRVFQPFNNLKDLTLIPIPPDSSAGYSISLSSLLSLQPPCDLPKSNNNPTVPSPGRSPSTPNPTSISSAAPQPAPRPLSPSSTSSASPATPSPP